MKGMCSNPDCDSYPIYGVAPHECYWRKPGGFEENPLGTSTIVPLEDWPDNFEAEIDPDKPVAEQLSWGLCGVHYCPECKNGMGSYDDSYGREALLELLAREAA